MNKLSKALFILMILLMLGSVCLFASERKRITAYKLTMNGSLPKRTLTVRCIVPEGDEITEGMDKNLSAEFRGEDLPAFRWICSGNLWNEATVSFSFGPLLHTVNKSDYIKYTVYMEHSESRIGNLTLGNGSLPSENTTKRVFPDDSPSYAGMKFAIIYADNPSIPDAFSVSHSNVEKEVSYDMSTYSRVYLRSENDDAVVDTEYDKTEFGTALSTNTDYQNTCEFWNRYGTVNILLDVSEENEEGKATKYFTEGGTKACAIGVYEASVTVSVAAI